MRSIYAFLYRKLDSMGLNGMSRVRSGEGNGTPLQYSSLENRMDGGAW